MRKTLSIMLVVALTFVCSLAISISTDFAYAATSSGNIHAKNSTLEQPDSNHVYFGSYPQTEIVGEASQSGVYGKPWSKATDFIEDSELYAELKSAQWDVNNDTVINGSRYHKIAPEEKIFSASDNEYSYSYNWKTTPSDHFFKYEPIRWRVLKIADNDAFLFCDTILYEHKYHSEYVKVSWETSAIRTWLNDTFYNSAFNSAEKNIIKETNVVNSDNVTYGTTGGNDTVDKVFLLSENEVFGQNAVQYGFDGSASTTDSARRMRSSTFAKATGSSTTATGNWLGNADWWLRSPGRSVASAATVKASGAVDSKGLIVCENHKGVCPAIHIQLNSSNPIAVECSFSEMELSDYNYIYDGNEKKPEVHIEGLTEGIDYTVSYENCIGPGRATAIATGIGAYEGSIVTEYGIGYELPDSISLSDSTYVYDGKEKTPSVTVGDLIEGTDYSVKYSDNTEAGTASVIIEGINNYVGTKTKTFTISQLDIKDASVTVEEAHFIETGNEIRPAVSIGDLVEGRDFETHYYDNIDAGTGSITIIGKGSCKGTVYKTFDIHSLLKTDAIEATCVNDGNKEYWVCSCGKYYSDSSGENEIDEGSWVIEAKGHTYSNWTITKEATCTEDGSKEKACEVCEDKVTEVIPATGHKWNDEYTVDKEASCTEEGSRSIHCSVCNAIDESTVEAIQKTEHKYGDWKVIKEANCTEDGSKEKVCEVCEDKVTEVIPAKGHTWNEEYTTDKAATCTEEGSKSKHCSVCNAINEPTVEAIPKIDHTYGDWKVTKEATCTEDGSKEKVCSVCEDKVIEVIQATGHQWNQEYTIDKQATCTEEGSKSIHCSVCNVVDETTVTVIPKSDHAYGDWKITKEANCTETGSKEKICSVCGDKVTDVIPAAGHKWNEDYTTDLEPTCTSEGSESLHCTVCNETYADSIRVIPRLEHAYGDWVTTQEPTCTEDGIRTKTCNSCGDTVTDTVPATGHKWNSDYTTDKEATHSEPGLESIHCSVCGAIQEGSEQEIPVIEHEYTEWIITNEPTCTEEGSKRRGCSGCDIIETQTLPAAGHHWSREYTVDKEATCSAAGSESIHCEVCGVIQEGSVKEIVKLPHTPSEGRITKAPTVSEEGVMTYTCGVCSEDFTVAIPKLTSEAAEAYSEVDASEAAAAEAKEAAEQIDENSSDSTLAETDQLASDAVIEAENALAKAAEAIQEVIDSDAGTEAAIYAQSMLDEAKVVKAEALTASSIVKKAIAEAAGKKAKDAKTAAENAAATPGATAVAAAENALKFANDAAEKAAVAAETASTAFEAVKAAGYAENSPEYKAAETRANETAENKLAADAEVTAAANAVTAAQNAKAQAEAAAASAAAVPAEIIDLPVVKISKPAAAKKAVTVKWKKVTKKNLKKIQGIEIQVATDPGFTDIVKTTTAGKKKTNKKIKGLASKQTYFVRIRAYKNAADGKHVSVWKTKKVKVK